MCSANGRRPVRSFANSHRVEYYASEREIRSGPYASGGVLKTRNSRGKKKTGGKTIFVASIILGTIIILDIGDI